MGFLPSQDNYTPDGPTSTTGTFTPGGFNPINMVASARGMADTLVNKFILKPVNANGIGGFVFDYEGDTQVNGQSDITDHYTEQNAFINDQATQKPNRITLRGFVGELVANPNGGVLGALNTLQSKLTTLSAITGKYTPAIVQKIQAGVTSAQSVVNTVDNDISRAQNALAFVTSFAPGGNSAKPSRQQKAYQQLETLRLNNTVFTLNTPMNYFKSVMIEHLMAIQDESTQQWMEFSVTVKEVRFLQTPPATPGDSQDLALQNRSGRNAYSAQAQSQQGNVQGMAVPIASSSLFSSFGHVTQPAIGNA
jgi:hypothetical protein